MFSEWWQDYKNLFAFASTAVGNLDGTQACFHLRKEGSPVFCDDSVLVRARILQELQTTLEDGRVSVLSADSPQRLAVLRVTYADWNTLGQHCQSFRALWAGVRVRDEVVVLDTTTGPAFLTADVVLQENETIQVAELFSGGFAGWSQATWLLSTLGVPIRTSWMLEMEDHLFPPLQTMEPDLQPVSTKTELEAVDCELAPVALMANIEHDWWHGIWTRAAPHMLVMSPPCQPWATPGRGQGLDTPDGRLLLRVAALMQAVRTPVVCIEEVAGFAAHPHFADVMEAWREAGYQLVSREMLQLAEVAPTWRRRLMLVFVHQETGPGVDAAQGFVTWQAVPRPSLAIMRAYFPVLPGSLAQPCQLSAELLQTYLDPWYMPPGQKTDVDSVRAFRLCNPHQRAKCFMAAYHRQHLLPEGLLTRGGLLCSLLTTGADIRFFSAPEIASCHGAVRTQLLLIDDEQSMRLHGNALAVPQAALTISNALRWLAPHVRLDPAEVVRRCIDERLHSRNSVLLKVKQGWLWVKHDDLGYVLADKALRAEIETCMRSPPAQFHVLQLGLIESGAFRCVRQVFVSVHIPVDRALQRLGAQTPATWTCPQQIKQATVLQVPTAQLPALNLSAGGMSRAADSDLVLLCTPRAMVLVHKSVPDVLHQLRWTFEKCRENGLRVTCLTCFGEPLSDIREFPGTCFVATETDDLLFNAPALDWAQVRACQSRCLDGAFQLLVEPQCATDWWLQLPCHLLECLGWKAEATDPTEASPMCISFSATGQTDAVGLSQLRQYLRELFFLSQIRAVAREPDGALFGPVALQVEGRVIWVGRVPADLTAAQLVKFWHNACRCFDCWPIARVYSGPFPIDCQCPVSQLAAEGRVQTKGAQRTLALTVFPETRGGGNKDDQVQLAKSRCAALLLDRGVSLAEVTVAVDRLVSKLGASACMEPLSLPDATARFQRLCQVAHPAGIDLPAGDNRTEKAAQRIQKAIRRRRLQAAESVAAADFELLPDTWCGIDNQPVPVLQRISHGASGVMLVDASVANAQDNALLQNMCSEALCLVVPGHRCPDPDTCSGACNVPVKHRGTGKKHLLAACFHNVGETDIRPYSEHSVQVALADTVCCSFAMYQDEAPSDATWQEVVKAPVRAVTERFRSQGISQPLSQPWGRSFRCNGRPCQPHLCDSLMFHAKVPGPTLSKVLQCSGFNFVYVVPRTWDRQLLPDWSVIWLKSGRAEVEKQALLVPGQHGLVRGKSRYGLRVGTHAFQSLFKQLRPGEPVPATIDTKLLFKVGPLPPAAPSEALTEWACLGWSVRRCLLRHTPPGSTILLS